MTATTGGAERLKTDRVRTVRREGVWVNEIESEGETSRHRTKDEAAAVGREIAHALGVEHVVHNHDGSVGSRTNYGSEGAQPSA
jgi:hypothetical protein